MNRCVAVLVGAVLAAVSASGGDAVRGHLYIIGGGDRPPELMLPYIGLAGGAGKARICVLPMASATPESTGVRLAQEFLALGAREAFPLVVTRATADDPATVRKLDGVSGVFFSGGDQSRVTAAILNTATHRRLLELYRSGAVIGGTSAGAAIMSRVMITGDERLNKDTVNAFLFIRRDNVVTTEGLGFIEGAIIDQHFVYRKRHNRLISLVLEHPSLVGIGIDEATALVVNPDQMLEVRGEGTVVVYDARRASAVRTDSLGNLSGRDLRMHVLSGGDRFTIVEGGEPPKEKPR